MPATRSSIIAKKFLYPPRLLNLFDRGMLLVVLQLSTVPLSIVPLPAHQLQPSLSILRQVPNPAPKLKAPLEASQALPVEVVQPAALLVAPQTDPQIILRKPPKLPVTMGLQQALSVVL